jgi:hypothetical protein
MRRGKRSTAPASTPSLQYTIFSAEPEQRALDVVAVVLDPRLDGGVAAPAVRLLLPRDAVHEGSYELAVLSIMPVLNETPGCLL